MEKWNGGMMGISNISIFQYSNIPSFMCFYTGLIDINQKRVCDTKQKAFKIRPMTFLL